jgi:hypothetical protein
VVAGEPPPAATAPATEKGGINGMAVGGSLITGVAVAMGVVNVWAFTEMGNLTDDAGYEQYAHRFTDKDDVCEQAELGNPGVVNIAATPGAAAPATVADICSDHERAKTLFAISLPSTIVLSAVGAAMLSLAVPDDGPDVAVVPLLSPGFGGIGLTWHY